MGKRPRLASPYGQARKSSKVPHLTLPVGENPPLESRYPTPTQLAKHPSHRIPIQGVKPIPTFGRKFCSMTRKRRRYNDDVYPGPYKPAVLHFPDSRRKGIRESMGSCRNYEHQAPEALQGRFPLSHLTPLPTETREAAAYIRDTSPDAILKVWDAQLTALDELAHGCKLAPSTWNACIPEEIPTSDGEFQTVSMKQLMNQL